MLSVQTCLVHFNLPLTLLGVAFVKRNEEFSLMER